MSLMIFTYHQASGVPQGSHLGPLLFLVFINDLPRVFKYSIKLLLIADDAKLFCSIQSISDSETLQDQLNKFYAWSVNNCLELKLISVTLFHLPVLKIQLY
uniref:Reverse transcriptase domain-containing protein n=1 Tax=Schizaphis graminum TaxID=13262 RepID=A0A2S2NW67_SCHGA